MMVQAVHYSRNVSNASAALDVDFCHINFKILKSKNSAFLCLDLQMYVKVTSQFITLGSKLALVGTFRTMTSVCLNKSVIELPFCRFLSFIRLSFSSSIIGVLTFRLFVLI